MWSSFRRASRLKNVSQVFPTCSGLMDSNLSGSSLSRFRDSGCQVLSQMFLFGFSENDNKALVRGFSTRSAEFEDQGASDLPNGNLNDDNVLSQGNTFEKLNKTKGKILGSSNPKMDVNGGTGSRDKFKPYLFQIIFDTPIYSLRSVLDKWIEDGNSLDRNELIMVLYHLKKHRLYMKALKFMELMKRGKLLNYEEGDYACHLDLTARSHGIKSAQKYIERVPLPFRKELLYETLLANCVCEGNTGKAEEVFKKIRDLSLALTVSACNQMLLLYKRSARHKVVDILMLMEKENIKPSPLTYNILIELKGRSNDMAGIELVLNEMKASGLEPNFATLTAVAKIYIDGGLKEKAEAVIKEIEMSKDKRHAIRCLLHLYAALRKPDDVARIWKMCTEPNLEDVLAAINAWDELGHIEQAERAFEAMRKITPKLSSKYYNAMLNVYGKNKLVAKGKDFIQRMSFDGCPHGPLTWDTLVKLYVNSGEVGKADSFLLNATEQNPDRQPLFNSYLLLLREYAKRGDVHNSEKIFHRLKGFQYRGRTPPYDVLLEAYVNAKVQAHGFSERMKADNVHPIKKITEHLKFLNKLQKVGISEVAD